MLTHFLLDPFPNLGSTGVFRFLRHLSVYWFRYFTILCRKKNWCNCGMAHITFLNLLAQTKVCSQAMVLNWGGTLSSALYSRLHLGSTWFLKCSLSITFCNSFQASFNGFGKGRSFLEIFKLSTWHMLS